MLVSCEGIDLSLRADIPHATGAITTTSDEEVESGVHIDAIDSIQVAVVVTNDFVLLQIPAQDFPVLTSREEIIMTMRDMDTTNGRNVTGESEF